jgi:hypothetical protein
VSGSEDRGIIHARVDKFGNFEKWISMHNMLQRLVDLVCTCHGAGPEYPQQLKNKSRRRDR